MNNPNYSKPVYADPNGVYQTPAEPENHQGKQ